MLVSRSKKFAWLVLFAVGPYIVYASDQPTPTDAPPDFAPPAGPPPPPPLPIDDDVLLMVVVALIFGFIFLVNKTKAQCS